MSFQFKFLKNVKKQENKFFNKNTVKSGLKMNVLTLESNKGFRIEKID